MPIDGPPLPDPKARTLARGPRRYRRKVAGAKGWAAILSDKAGPCRVCCDAKQNGARFQVVQLHHIVTRQDHGDDVSDNIVPLCFACHDLVTRRDAPASRALIESLSDAEYAYKIQRGGEGYPERAYGVRYAR